jgi:hypothetical protein
MKPTTAFVFSLLAGAATFAAQYNLFPPRLHAAPFLVPKSPNWRQQMIERDQGAVGIDHAIAHLTNKLNLSADQAREFRPLLEQQHERILALLLTAPQSLTRGQFVTKQREIVAQTRKQVHALLTPDQIELARELAPPAIS